MLQFLTVALLGLSSFVTALPRTSLRREAPVKNQTVDPFPYPDREWRNVSCLDPVVGRAAAPPTDRWKAAHALDAWNDLMVSWSSGPRLPTDVKLPFTAYTSSVFGGPEQWNCQEILDIPCSTTVECEHVNAPAGFLILNSFSAIHRTYQRTYDALTDAQAAMQADIGTFAAIFAPEDKSPSIVKILLGGLAFFVGFVSSFQWNIIIKEYKIFSGDRHGLYKDWFNSAASSSITLAKDTLPSAQSAIAIQNSLSSALGTIFTALKDTHSTFMVDLFSGTNKNNGLNRLASLMADGVVLAIPTNLVMREMVVKIQAMLYARLVIIAWRNAPEKRHPFVLMTENICGTDLSDLEKEFIDPLRDAPKTQMCYNGKRAYILNGVFSRKMLFCEKGGICNDAHAKPRLQLLPGGEVGILKGERFGGLTLEDLLVSSYEGYVLNGMRNGYKIPENSMMKDGTGTLTDFILESGVRTPGYVNLPVCTDWRKTLRTLESVQPGNSEYWPCDEP